MVKASLCSPVAVKEKRLEEAARKLLKVKESRMRSKDLQERRLGGP